MRFSSPRSKVRKERISLFPFLRLSKKRKPYTKSLQDFRNQDYRYRALILETEIELVKAKMLPSSSKP